MEPTRRRDFLKKATGLALGWIATRHETAFAAETFPNPVGYATISWPEKDFDEALKTTSELGYQGLQMLGWVRDSYAGAKQAELKKQLQALKLKPLALSCSNVHLRPDDATDSSDQFRSYAEFMKILGGSYLQVTDGGRPDTEYSVDAIKGLAERMNALGKIAQDHRLVLGYHPHVGTLGETREGMGRILDATDPKHVKLIADVAHMTLGGADPAEIIRTYHERLIFFHFKDVRKDVMDLARQGRDKVRRLKYRFCEIGKGTVDYPAILKAIRDISFRGWIIVELDAYELPPGGPGESARLNKEALEKMGFKV